MTKSPYMNDQPEGQKRKNRREAMRIVERPYGQIKIFHHSDEPTFACEKCVYNSGVHTCGR